MDKQDILNKGFHFFAVRDYEKAIMYFKKALELDDKFELAYSAIAESYNRLGLIDEAIPFVKKWIELRKDDPLAHTALSRLYVQNGMREEAEKEMALSNYYTQQQNRQH